MPGVAPIPFKKAGVKRTLFAKIGWHIEVNFAIL